MSRKETICATILRVNMNNMEYAVILMKNVNTKNAIHGQTVQSAIVENTVLNLKMKMIRI